VALFRIPLALRHPSTSTSNPLRTISTESIQRVPTLPRPFLDQQTRIQSSWWNRHQKPFQRRLECLLPIPPWPKVHQQLLTNTSHCLSHRINPPSTIQTCPLLSHVSWYSYHVSPWPHQ
jgi:hypothetical protein